MRDAGDVIPLLLAGGGGTRLWPASLLDRPKHLLELPPGSGRSLLAHACERARELGARVFAVTTAAQRDSVRAAIPDATVLVEPRGRNTGPCVALSLILIERQLAALGWSPARIDEAVLVVMPSDHHVADGRAFVDALAAAADHARAGRCVTTLGITPDRPATAYGYIERGPAPLELVGAPPAYAGLRFVEKPDAARARHFLESGRFLWNAGVFAATVATLRAAFHEHAPTLLATLAAADDATLPTAYDAVEPVAFDVAIMERLPGFRVIPAAFSWSDLGSWQSVHEALPSDARGNTSHAAGGRSVALIDADDCLVWSEEADVAVIGVRGLAVVCAHGRALVCPLQRAQEVREAARQLEDRGLPERSGDAAGKRVVRTPGGDDPSAAT
ncbi:MAG: mannose-1-phosphate guanylyltransferase [Myxococcales bacterium]|nr:mannose-1-phosphate guanylyltransferase [Myxococcales bacterium]